MKPARTTAPALRIKTKKKLGSFFVKAIKQPGCYIEGGGGGPETIRFLARKKPNWDSIVERQPSTDSPRPSSSSRDSRRRSSGDSEPCSGETTENRVFPPRFAWLW
jgi:hypothetical protein